MKVYIIFCFIFLLQDCSPREKKRVIDIIVTVKNIPSDKIYLVDAYQFTKALDSAYKKNDTFAFHLRVSEDFVPSLVSLSYFDPSNDSKVLCFKNYILSPKPSVKYMATAFMLERGITSVHGDFLSPDKLDIDANKETDLYFELSMSDFGFMNTKDSAGRRNTLNKIKSFIKRNSFSFYLMSCIYNNRALYNKKELREIVTLFDDNVWQSSLGKRILDYISNMPDPGGLLPHAQLLSSTGGERIAIDYSNKLNLLVFWASWCGPCRLEIPSLKFLDSNYRNAGVSISSIAVSDSKESWIKAVTLENMPWRQLYVDSLDNDKIRANFSIGSIPVIIFVNKSGKELKREIGFDANSLKNDTIFINEFLRSH